jgi:hypothetical protein
MGTAQLLLGFVDEAALRREYDTNLRHGRAFIAGASGIERLAACTLRLMRSDTFDMLELDAQVVLVSDAEPMRGIAVQLTGSGWREQLAHFVGAQPLVKEPPNAPSPAEEAPPVTARGPQPTSPQSEPPPITPRVSVSPALLAGATDRNEAESTASPTDETPTSSEAEDEDAEKYINREHAERRQRIRNMSAADRGRVAHGSSLEDRVLLERIFGSAVWEMLLRSTTLTPPEVANIARKGSLSVPLIELVADNPNWIRQDVVRRALLSNPRIPPHTIMKVLHAVPRNELKIMAEGATTYPAKVRSALQTLRGKKS